MQKNTGPSLSALVYAFAWRWLIASVVAWALGFLLLIIVVIIVVVIAVIATGATDPEAIKDPVTSIITMLSIPIFCAIIPGFAALIAFVWVLYSSQIKAMVAPPGSRPLSVALPGATPGTNADAYTQYTQAYQRWQKDYAVFQETKKARNSEVPDILQTLSDPSIQPAVATDSAIPQTTQDTPAS